MTLVLELLFVQGLLGAFDTLYYHEHRARLPARFPGTAPELKLHALRSLIYAILFGTLPRISFQGAWLPVLFGLFLAEIILTLKDFVVEDQVRKPLGGVYAGERVMHAVMGILYGAMLAVFLPIAIDWWSLPTGFSPVLDIPRFWVWSLSLMSLGVGISGLRDLAASFGIRAAAWPWPLHP